MIIHMNSVPPAVVNDDVDHPVPVPVPPAYSPVPSSEPPAYEVCVIDNSLQNKTLLCVHEA